MQSLICDTHTKTLKVYEDQTLIKTISNIAIGINGVTKDKKEGDGKTPLGKYSLGIAFSTHKLALTYPNFTINPYHYWVDDINSNYYNQLVDLSITSKDFQSAEHLIDYPNEYEYGLVINYNPECLKGKGSAIFLHIKTSDVTHGCIAIDKKSLIFILNFLDRSQNPIIKII